MANLNLAAAVNPLEVYSQVFHDAVANIGTLAENADPGRVLAQIVANQIDSARSLAEALQTAGGDIATAVTT